MLLLPIKYLEFFEHKFVSVTHCIGRPEVRKCDTAFSWCWELKPKL